MTAEPMAIIHFLRICKNNGYDKTYPLFWWGEMDSNHRR